ncbi:MAG TPA: 30S ribosomal protein S12 methylthiotransferase RimO [Bdellovibrionota bacterium]|nr:30S ribosomal protein S12 methylthiotransferase RimO [Bdellovibrionota bacterium]
MGPEKPQLKVGLISLGCPKNLVDSEVMLGLLKKEGCELTKDESQADVMIVNTCAFIEASKKESIETILDVARRKSDGSLKKLIVTGCLAQRYREELEKEMPEVDHFIGTGEFHRITEFTKVLPAFPPPRSAVDFPEYVYDYATPRISTLPRHTAYVKIAEGCSRTCSFCIIPRLRGPNRSRTIDSIAREVENLAAEGAVELSLIAQDLTAYGLDLGDGTDLEKLLRRLIEIDGIRWIRLLYNYPMYFTDGLIDVIANSEKICKYVDIPLQHIDSDLLATMRRKVDEREVRGLLEKLKSSIPGLALRTTLIVGFPGESAEQFGRLVDFVKEYEFNRLGVFTYSQEERTAAAKMPGQIPTKVKKERRNRIMAIAQKISARKNLEKLGRVFDVLIDRALESPNGYSHVGRTEGQALDIDGQVFVAGASMRPGTFVRAKVEKAGPYDLFARTY